LRSQDILCKLAGGDSRKKCIEGEEEEGDGGDVQVKWGSTSMPSLLSLIPRSTPPEVLSFSNLQLLWLRQSFSSR